MRQVVLFPFVFYSDHYLATVTWVTDERIAVQWQKRKQNELRFQIYDFSIVGNTWIENALEVRHKPPPTPRFPAALVSPPLLSPPVLSSPLPQRTCWGPNMSHRADQTVQMTNNTFPINYNKPSNYILFCCVFRNLT